MASAGMSDESHSVVIAHLTMVQGVVARMGANAFTVKTLSVTLAAAIIAVASAIERFPAPMAFAAVVAIIMFALIDAQYLRLERAFRRLYDDIRLDEDVEPYALTPTGYLKDIPYLQAIFSWSILGIYSVLIAIVAVVYLHY